MLGVVLERKEDASERRKENYQEEDASKKRKENYQEDSWKDQWTWDMILGPGKLRSKTRS